MYNDFQSRVSEVGETLIKLPGEIDGEQFLVEDLDNCKVNKSASFPFGLGAVLTALRTFLMQATATQKRKKE